MQKPFRLLTAFILLLVSSGCSEDLQVVLPGPPIPVIFGVFDTGDSVHYIKLSKSFSGFSNPYQLASENSNVFYDDARIYLYGYNGTHRSYFEKITQVPRETGYFPRLPNEYYALERKLNPGYYHVTVLLPEEDDTLTAQFTLLSELEVLQPRKGMTRFYFYEDPTVFAWKPHPGAGLYEISFSLIYEEVLKTGYAGKKTITHSRQLRPGHLEFERDRYNYRYYSDPFFAYLSTQVKPDDEVDYRKPLELSIRITAADTVLARYINWYGLEIDDKINPNGNIPGAIGVIGSIYTVTFPGLSLSSRSQDSLIKGHYTRDLGFVGNSEW